MFDGPARCDGESRPRVIGGVGVGRSALDVAAGGIGVEDGRPVVVAVAGQHREGVDRLGRRLQIERYPYPPQAGVEHRGVVEFGVEALIGRRLELGHPEGWPRRIGTRGRLPGQLAPRFRRRRQIGEHLDRRGRVGTIALGSVTGHCGHIVAAAAVVAAVSGPQPQDQHHHHDQQRDQRHPHAPGSDATAGGRDLGPLLRDLSVLSLALPLVGGHRLKCSGQKNLINNHLRDHRGPVAFSRGLSGAEVRRHVGGQRGAHPRGGRPCAPQP